VIGRGGLRFLIRIAASSLVSAHTDARPGPRESVARQPLVLVIWAEGVARTDRR